MKRKFQSIYNELKKKALDQFHITSVLPRQSIAITRDLIQVTFDRNKGVVPAGSLGVISKGWIEVRHAIKEGLIIAIFLTDFAHLSNHKLAGVQPDYLNLHLKNLLWFDLNSRILLIREVYYVSHNKNPPKLVKLAPDNANAVVQSEIEGLFKLDS